ncbi:MAG: molybdopterin-dependent oxidoreductase [Aliarcobacter sp.]|nr:molybdopterin-dependent oxidoreductase [Aliarcobacter sp.]
MANKLMKGFIGTNNVDTNSRNSNVCQMLLLPKKNLLGTDYVPVRMNDVHDANLLILVGANTAEAHVVFHNRIKTAKKQGLKIIVIDPQIY